MIFYRPFHELKFIFYRHNKLILSAPDKSFFSSPSNLVSIFYLLAKGSSRPRFANHTDQAFLSPHRQRRPLHCQQHQRALLVSCCLKKKISSLHCKYIRETEKSMGFSGTEQQRRTSGSPPLRTSPSSSNIGVDRKKPFLIGVAGGTASGKSTVCERIIEEVINQQSNSEKQIISLSQDSFYKELNETESALALKGNFNFDHPDAFDHELMLDCLKAIHDGKPTKIPVYDFKTNARKAGEFKTIYPSDVVLLEGILIFYHDDVRKMFDMKLFVDTDADTRLARRVLRDIEQRGRDLEHVLFQYTTLVKPAFEEFCLPTKKYADVIIPRGADNSVAIELVAQHIQDIIWTRNSSSKSGSPFNRSRSNSDSMIR